ncbi:MAG TPA: hypothetical protein PLM98_10000, partial [Thiolinea sp.]|nr:hypothetical protein [Thiolinea sp.]
MAGYSVRNLIVIALLLAAGAWQYFSGQVGHKTSTATTQTAVPPANPVKTIAQLRDAAKDSNAK